MVCKCGHFKVNHLEGIGCMVSTCPCKRYTKYNSIRFVLPSMPVSVNGIYQIIYSQRRVELKPEAWRWKRDAKEHMPPWKLHSRTSLICLDVVFYYDFYDSNGNLVDKDTHNYMKLLQDAVAERYGFRDKRVKRCPIDSRPSKDERVAVIVSEYYLSEGELEIKKGENSNA